MDSHQVKRHCCVALWELYFLALTGFTRQTDGASFSLNVLLSHKLNLTDRTGDTTDPRSEGTGLIYDSSEADWVGSGGAKAPKLLQTGALWESDRGRTTNRASLVDREQGKRGREGGRGGMRGCQRKSGTEEDILSHRVI